MHQAAATTGNGHGAGIDSHKLAPNALQLPAPLPPIELPSPKTVERTHREVVLMGEVAYEQQLAPDYCNDQYKQGVCCGCCFSSRRRQQGHVVDVKVIRPPAVEPTTAKLGRSTPGPIPVQPPPQDPTLDAITVSISERTTYWAASPALKGLLRSPFATGMRSVSRDKPGRLYRGGSSLQGGTPRRTQSEPAPPGRADYAHEHSSTTKRVAFSVHA